MAKCPRCSSSPLKESFDKSECANCGYKSDAASTPMTEERMAELFDFGDRNKCLIDDEVDEVHAEVRRLRAENDELRHSYVSLNGRLRDAEHERDLLLPAMSKLEAENAGLREECNRLATKVNTAECDRLRARVEELEGAAGVLRGLYVVNDCHGDCGGCDGCKLRRLAAMLTPDAGKEDSK